VRAARRPPQEGVLPMLKSLALAAALFAVPAFAAAPDAYQVTGVVKDTNADTITVVKKSGERFVIARGGDTTAVNVGDKVTVHYTMTATKIEAKAAK
jgi:streptogramin lyase